MSTNIIGRLKAIPPFPRDDESWRPLVIRLSNLEGREALEKLLNENRVRVVHDSIEDQLRDLASTRTPGLEGDALQAASEALRGGVPADEHGCWVFYPWDGRLVHVIDEAELRELRTDRNRNKITREEQERLGSLRIGVVGLSVGQASAVTLAMEGVGGNLRLADFDALSASNLNRLRAGVHDIGTKKALITAREIYEIDPYAKLDLFTEGVTPENLDAFLTEPQPLDLVIEECDDLAVKLLVRERARALGIPVLMETSDRGMIDIERFDLEPDRPLLHGLVGDLRAEDVAGLSVREKVPLLLRMVGAETMSRRMAASLPEVRRSLASWPQLASAVALGGALVTDVARRIALDQLHVSGRFYVDLEEVISDSSVSHVAHGDESGPSTTSSAR